MRSAMFVTLALTGKQGTITQPRAGRLAGTSARRSRLIPAVLPVEHAAVTAGSTLAASALAQHPTWPGSLAAAAEPVGTGAPRRRPVAHRQPLDVGAAWPP